MKFLHALFAGCLTILMIVVLVTVGLARDTQETPLCTLQSPCPSVTPLPVVATPVARIETGQMLDVSTGVVSPADQKKLDACTDEWICFYDCTNNGCGHWFTNSSINGCQMMGYDRLGNWMGDRTSYIVNDGLWPFLVYDYYNCSGAVGTIYAHSQGAMDAYWNNHIGATKRDPCYPIGC
jgi:hypothetical protein